MHLSPLKPLLLLLLSGAFLHAQNPKVYEDYNALLAQKQTVATQPSVYVNKKYGYQMAVPPWLDLQNTGDERVAGGLLPRVSGIQNAVAVKASDKREFPDFNAYIDFVYGANEAGKPMKMSPNMTWEGGQEVSGAAHPTYEVFIKARNLIYHCRFVLMETPKAYLLIDLWATESTYFQNLDRFKEFLAGVKPLAP